MKIKWQQKKIFLAMAALAITWLFVSETLIAQVKISTDEKAPEDDYFLHSDGGVKIYHYMPTGSPAAGAKSKLEKDVQPIIMANINYDINFFYLFYKGSYEYSRGGSVEQKSQEAMLEDIDADPRTRFILKQALGIAGVEAEATIMQFSSGTAMLYEEGVSLGSSPLQLTKNQYDLRYHFLWQDIPRLGGSAKATKADDSYAGLRYLQYTLPRIAYQTKEECVENCDSEESVSQEIVKHETPAQFVPLNAVLVGIGYNTFMKAVKPGFNWIYSIDFYGGLGEASLLLQEGDSKKQSFDAYVGMAGLSLGFVYNLFGGPAKGSVRVLYQADYYYTQLQKDYEFGEQDLFHAFYLGFDINI